MFSAIRKVLTGLAARVRAPAREQAAAQERVLLALARQVRAAQAVRQLAQLEALGARLLPARLLPVLQEAVRARVLALPIPTPGSRRSTGSSGRTGRRSTSKRRRAR